MWTVTIIWTCQLKTKIWVPRSGNKNTIMDIFVFPGPVWQHPCLLQNVTFMIWLYSLLIEEIMMISDTTNLNIDKGQVSTIFKVFLFTHNFIFQFNTTTRDSYIHPFSKFFSLDQTWIFSHWAWYCIITQSSWHCISWIHIFCHVNCNMITSMLH